MSFFEDASLVYIPAAIKNGKTYSIKPTDGTGDLTFTRASSATRVGPNGYIEKVRENLYPRGSALLSTGWTSVGATLTAGQTDPNGGTTALRVQLAAAQSPYAYILQTFTGSASTYTRSAFIKGATAQSIRIVDPYTGAGTTINLTTSYQRFASVGAGTPPSFGIQFDNNNDDLAKDFTIAFVQIEEGDVATDYIATTTAAVSVGPVSGTPRLDYLGSDCPRLLLEPARTNIFAYSEIFSNADWNKRSGISITSNYGISPDGYQNADRVVYSSGDGYIYKLLTPTANATYTISVYAKGSGSISFNMYDGFNAFMSSTFNLTSEWARYSFTATMSSNTAGGDFGFFVPQTCEIWGAQCEIGAYASSLIPTLGTAVTRVADAASRTSASALIGQTEGTLFAEVDITNFKDGRTTDIVLTVYASSSNRIMISFDGIGPKTIYVFIRSSAVSYDVSQTQIFGLGLNKLAFSYGNNYRALYLNGAKIYESTDTFPVPSIPNIAVGSRDDLTGQFGDGIKQVLVFPNKLTDAQAIEITTI